MTVKIKRNTGFFGMASSFRVIVNGEKRERITNNQTIVVDLPSDTARIQVTQQGVKSKEMNVRTGDEFEITTSLLGKLFLPLLIIVPLLTKIIPNITIRTVLSAILLFGGLLLAVCFFVPGAIFQIRKLGTKP